MLIWFNDLFQTLIVGVEDIFESRDYTFIVMELMAGGSLQSRLTVGKEQVSLDETIVRLMAYQLLLGLEYLHSKNIIHRDIKPANILLVSDNKGDSRVKLADFGLSKLVTESKLALTKCGTNKFMAPEVVSSDRKSYSSQIDVWSLGITLFLWSVIFFL